MSRSVIALVPLGEPAIADPFAAVSAAVGIAAGQGRAAIAIVFGPGAETAAEELGREGAEHAVLATHPGLVAPVPPEHFLVCLEALLVGGDHLCILPAGAVGEELAARLAVRLGGVALGRCSAIICEGDRVMATRASHGGRAEAVLESTAARCFATMRRAAAPPAVATPACRHAELAMALPPAPPCETLPATGPQARRLEGARLVVSGGRGMGGAEGFSQLAALAATLDAALGASLPAVDAGWASVAQQVGQSGAFVAPELYFAVGISGTAQHLAGIATTSRIVALNDDPEAELFQQSELGVVGDWRVVLPALLARLADEP